MKCAHFKTFAVYFSLIVMQYFSRRLLAALGLASMLTVAAACSREVPILEYVPEPANLEVYCQRTSSQVTVKPGESFTIREEVGGKLVDVISLKLNQIAYRGYESNVNLTGTNLVFPQLDQNYTDNTFYFAGRTKQGRYIAAYRAEALRVDADSVTMRFGPERCVLSVPINSY